jgi:hypothetical protein
MGVSMLLASATISFTITANLLLDEVFLSWTLRSDRNFACKGRKPDMAVIALLPPTRAATSAATGARNNKSRDLL